MRTRLSRAEQQERTRQAITDAAERRFVDRGFHATSVDEIAADAGYTKGAVYSNFASKEDLFLAVYERRSEQAVEEVREIIERAPDAAAGLEAVAAEFTSRRRGNDGWLAVFFEFWAHVIRRPELRERFARIHAAAQQPFLEAVERHGAERGVPLAMDPASLVVAANAMQIGISLERLTRPDVVDETLGARMARLQLEAFADAGGDGRKT